MTSTVSKSVEHLTHFRCNACNGWWSIGDAPERDYWFCPWCGVKLESPAAPATELEARTEFENEERVAYTGNSPSS